MSSQNGNGEARSLAAQQMRSRLLSRLAGVQYGGERDIYAVAGYPKQLQFEHFWSLYLRGDVAGRIVDMPAKTTWKTPPAIVEEGEPEEGTEFTRAFTALAERLKLWSYLGRVDRLAGIGQYAVLLIGVKGTDDASLQTPLTRAKVDDLIYLAVYHEKNAQIESWVTDTGDERFGLPATYRLKTSSDTAGFNVKSSDLLVHSSRVIHVAENVLEDDTFGRPRLERPLNRLFDLDKVAASTGEAYWQQVTQILQAKIDKEVEPTEAQLKELDERLGEMVHDLRRQFFGRGVELGWLQTQTPNVQQVADFYFSLIAGSAGIPKRILFGSELGELASSQDTANYFGMINERQEQFAEPVILRPFIDRMIAIGALPKPTRNKGKYQVQWPPLFEESAKDKAEISLKKAQAAAALTPIGGNPRELVRINHEGHVELIERTPDSEGDDDGTPVDQ